MNFPDKKYKTIVMDPPWDLTPVFTSSFGMANFKFKDSLDNLNIKNAINGLVRNLDVLSTILLLVNGMRSQLGIPINRKGGTTNVSIICWAI